MKFQVFYRPKARKFIERLREKELQKRLLLAIDSLANDPHPNGSIKMMGEESLYRLRIGDYRAIYQVKNENKVILIVIIGHRKEVYR